MENNIDSQFRYTPIRQKNNKYPGPMASGIFFSLTTILLTYGGSLLAFKNDYLKSGLGEVLFILLPVLIFLIAGKYNIKETLKLRKTRPINYLIIAFLMMFGMPVVGVLNAVVLGIIRLIFGKNLPIPQISIPDVPTLLIAILVIGASAAICEETLFRGMISKGYERFGVVGSLITTSILFGILHRDIQKGVSTILLGAIIGYIVYRTKSIYAGMAAHFTNNTVAVILTYGTVKMTEKLDKMGLKQAQNFDFSSLPTASLIIAIVFYAILFLGFVAGFIGLLYAFYRSTQRDVRAETTNVQLMTDTVQEVSVLIETKTIEGESVLAAKKARGSKFSMAALICVLPGLILILLTFAGQILKLMDVNSGMIYSVLKTLWLI